MGMIERGLALSVLDRVSINTRCFASDRCGRGTIPNVREVCPGIRGHSTLDSAPPAPSMILNFQLFDRIDRRDAP